MTEFNLRRPNVFAAVFGVLFLILVWVEQFIRIGCQEWVGCLSQMLVLVFFGVAVLPVVAFVLSFVLIKEKKWVNAVASALLTEVLVVAVLIGYGVLNKRETARNVRDAEISGQKIDADLRARRPAMPPDGVTTMLRGTVDRVFTDREYGSYLDLHIDGDGDFSSRLRYLEGSLQKCANSVIDASQIQPRSYIEFHAMTIGIGAFSICDSPEYYIKVLRTPASLK